MEKKNNKSLPLIYVLGMPVIFIVANFIASLHITIAGSPLYFSVLLYPLTFLISGLIIKRTNNYKDALQIMAVSLISATLAFVVEWALMDKIEACTMIYAFLSFLICQLIFIYTYDFLIKIKKDTYIPVFILALIVITFLDNAFFGILVEGQTFSLSILIRVLYAVAIPVALAKKTSSK